MSAEKPAFPCRPRKFEDQDVIDAAVAVFSANGYAGTSAQDLCNGTGLGRGSLYNAFGSKQALYEQALLRSHEQTMSAQLAILTQSGLVKSDCIPFCSGVLPKIFLSQSSMMRWSYFQPRDGQ